VSHESESPRPFRIGDSTERKAGILEYVATAYHLRLRSGTSRYLYATSSTGNAHVAANCAISADRVVSRAKFRELAGLSN
jgi:hypothetical protein